MAHRGPRPSLLPPPVTPAPSIDRAEVVRIIESSCFTKTSYLLHEQAALRAYRLNRINRRGGVISAYRCPFHMLHRGNHWHVGHVPDTDAMARIAAAIRWCAQHPEQVPTPQTR